MTRNRECRVPVTWVRLIMMFVLNLQLRKSRLNLSHEEFCNCSTRRERTSRKRTNVCTYYFRPSLEMRTLSLYVCPPPKVHGLAFCPPRAGVNNNEPSSPLEPFYDSFRRMKSLLLFILVRATKSCWEKSVDARNRHITLESEREKERS